MTRNGTKKNRSSTIKQNKRNEQSNSKSNENISSNDSEGEASGFVRRSWLRDTQICLSSCLIVLAVYIRTLPPSITGGDTGELLVSAHELGVAHPPGYPLFTLASHLVMKVLPFSSPAWRVHLLNACFSAIAIGLLQLTTLRLTQCFGTSVFVIGLLGFSRLTWTWATTAEVFGLNNLFVSLLMLLTVIFEESQNQKKAKVACLGSFCCALSLCNQHTIIFYVAPIAVWVLYELYKQESLAVSTLLKIGFSFVSGLVPYLYLPISSAFNIAKWTWGDQTTLYGFIKHITRQEYGTFDLGKDQEGQGFYHGINAYVTHLLSEMFVVGPAFAVLGCLVAISRKTSGKQQSPFLFLVMLVLYASFFAWRANLDTTNLLFKGVVERFWLQSNFVVALLAGLGYHITVKWILKAVFSSEKLNVTFLVSLLGAVAVHGYQMTNYLICDQSGSYVIYNFASEVLNSMPQNALILTKGDLPTNTMRYLHLCENVRPDLQILDQEVLTYEWSLPMIGKFYPNVTFPGNFWHLRNKKLADGRRSFNFKAFLDKNYKRHSIFVCIGMQDHDPSWQSAYMLWPHGVCHKVIAQGTPIDPLDWAETVGPLADNWIYATNRFDETSWEKVANDEMWQAKISGGFFLYEQAEHSEDPQTKAKLLTGAYKLYKRAIEKNRVLKFPSFWHKNFALVCERLLFVESDMDKKIVCQESIRQFELYLKKEPSDKDYNNIIKAIDSLKKRLITLEQFEKLETVGMPKKP